MYDNPPPYMTKKGWQKFVSEVAALEDAAAEGNTWGPESDARILAAILVQGMRKPSQVSEGAVSLESTEEGQ